MPSSYEPLLDDDLDLPTASTPKKNDRHVVFAIDDEDDDVPLSSRYADDQQIAHHPRVLAEAQRLPPALKSTFRSREAEFELDTDELDDSHLLNDGSSSRDIRNQRDMPLLIGLLSQSSSRRSTEIPLTTMNGVAPEESPNVALHGNSGGMVESIVNMANSILGAGIIGLPYAIREAGFFFGIFLLLALCAITDWTIRLIVINAKLSGRNSYIGMMDHCFGPSGRAAISFFQFAFAFGGMCAFGIIIGDTIPHVIRATFPRLESTPIMSIFANRSFIVALCTICVSYPLSLYRDISKLARASGLALIGMLIIVISVVVEGNAVEGTLSGDPSIRFTFIGDRVFEAIGVISFAFVCHHNSLLIYGSLHTPTLDRFNAVTHVSTALSLLFCLLLGLAGYLVFTDKTQGNILNNFSPNDTLINIARFCFGLNMFTTLPLELFVCREVVEQFFFEHAQFDMRRHVMLTTIIVFASMILSLVTCDLGIMLEITGGISATALAYIFPALCFIKLSRDTPWRSRKIIAAGACVIFGVVVLILSVFLTIGKALKGEGGVAKVCT